MSSNVIHGVQVAYEDEHEKYIIDCNELAQKYINAEEKAYLAKKREEDRAIRAQMVANGEIPPEEEFVGLEETVPEVVDNSAIIAANEAAAEEILEEARNNAQAILDDANAQAEEILEAARANAEALKNLAQQEGEKDGYNQGTQRAAMELAAKQQEYDDSLAAIEQDYMNRALSLEREVVDVCCDVFQKVFLAQIDGKKDILYHLLDNCIRGIDPSHQMQIKVNEANVEFLRSKKNEIMERVGSDVVVDIIGDPVLSESQCIIDTDGGLFDCGIDTELDELIRSIRALG